MHYGCPRSMSGGMYGYGGVSTWFDPTVDYHQDALLSVDGSPWRRVKARPARKSEIRPELLLEPAAPRHIELE